MESLVGALLDEFDYRRAEGGKIDFPRLVSLIPVNSSLYAIFPMLFRADIHTLSPPFRATSQLRLRPKFFSPTGFSNNRKSENPESDRLPQILLSSVKKNKKNKRKKSPVSSGFKKSSTPKTKSQSPRTYNLAIFPGTRIFRWPRISQKRIIHMYC